eukprot:304578-Lingulodinium_polyedra.AAC.1
MPGDSLQGPCVVQGEGPSGGAGTPAMGARSPQTSSARRGHDLGQRHLGAGHRQPCPCEDAVKEDDIRGHGWELRGPSRILGGTGRHLAGGQTSTC